MKSKIHRIIWLIILLPLTIYGSKLFSSGSENMPVSEITEVQIGNYTWMPYNLNTDTFHTGDQLFFAQSAEAWDSAKRHKIPAYCYVKVDSMDYLSYGALYNWYAVKDERGIAPKGWHVATSAEWNYLNDYLGGWESCNKLKSKTGWPMTIYGTANGTNESGFTALPTGSRDTDSKFIYVNERAAWWGSAPTDTVVCFRYISVNLSAIDPNLLGELNWGVGLSVRCVKDK